MAGSGDGQEDRTEAATPRRLQRAREQGQVPVSRELPALASLAAGTLVLILLAPALMRDFAARLAIFLGRAGSLDLSDHLATAFHMAAETALRAAAPFVLAALVAGVVAVTLQSGFLFNLSALQPDLQRVSPRAGVNRLFGTNGLIEALKSCLKIIAMTVIIWQVTAADLTGLFVDPFWHASLLLSRTKPPVLHLLVAMLVAQTVITVFDVFWTRLRHARELRMSRHDVIQEQRETEGDPLIKSRLRQIRLRRSRRRMLAAVQRATVVVINPTHYAVALAYDRDKNAAPRVVAKGVDSMAMRIREVAAASKIPLVTNPPLARALYRVELDHDISAEHYQAVAEIIAYVWRLSRYSAGMAA